MGYFAYWIFLESSIVPIGDGLAVCVKVKEISDEMLESMLNPQNPIDEENENE